MRTRCSACIHPQVEAIEAALANGASARLVARQFGIGRDVLRRHMAHTMSSPSVAEVSGDGSPDLVGKDPLARAEATLAASLDLLDRAEGLGRVPLMVSALQGVTASTRQVIRSYRGTGGSVSAQDRERLEVLWTRALRVFNRSRDRGAVEAAALATLRSVVEELRQAGGDEEGFVEFTVRFPDSSPFPGSGTKPVLIPASKMPPKYRTGHHVIQLIFPGPREISLTAWPFQPAEPAHTNGNGRRTDDRTG